MRRQLSNLVLDQPTTSSPHAAETAPILIESAPSNASDDYDTRFHCPFPGCQRSFAELWRLKVHHRAPTDIRGSGKERGHGTELPMCPRVRETHMSDLMLQTTRISLAVYANPRPRKASYGLHSSLLKKEGTPRWRPSQWAQKSHQGTEKQAKRNFKCTAPRIARSFAVSRLKIKLR